MNPRTRPAQPSLMLHELIDLSRYPIDDASFRASCKAQLDAHGVLLIPEFLNNSALETIASEGDANRDKAFYTVSDHNVYLMPEDTDYAQDHPRNRLVSSSKGCITTDQIPPHSPLRTLYNNDDFKAFLCSVLDEQALFEYADPLSSINLHYASEGQELGWHFDNSSFAITLLIQEPDAGGSFEFVKDLRDTAAGDMSYEKAGDVLNGKAQTEALDMNAGCLVLFRGRDSMHRVTPTAGHKTRMLVVLAYNTEPDISLSESARMTFYGRLG